MGKLGKLGSASVILALMLAPVVLGAGAASAAEAHSNCVTFDNNGNVLSVTPNCTETFQTIGGQPQQMPGQNPCLGGTGIVTLAFKHSVFHVNVNGASDLWSTGTSNGTASYVPDDPTQPTFNGTFTNWFGEQENNKNLSLGDTFSVRLSDSLGDHITVHQYDHMTVTPGGIVHHVSAMTFSCG